MLTETSKNVIFQNLKLARSASNSVKNNRRLAPSKKTSFSQSVVFYAKNNPPRPSRHAPNLWNPKGRTKRTLGRRPYREKGAHLPCRLKKGPRKCETVVTRILRVTTVSHFRSLLEKPHGRSAGFKKTTNFGDLKFRKFRQPKNNTFSY